MAEPGHPSRDDLLRKALFVPCPTRQALHNWIRIYLGLDLPMTTVSDDSTMSPMDAVWLVYDAFRCRRFNLPGKLDYKELKELMVYASRDSFKTVIAAILEVAVLLHMGLSVAHMAAIDKQSKKAQSYVKQYFEKPFIRDFVTVQNETRIEVTHYKHRATGLVLQEEQFQKMAALEQENYDRHWNYITIVICTMAGANSEHVPLLVVDEVDVILPQNIRAYGEAKMIPSPWQGVAPITLYISTRKTSTGLVQQEIDNAHETGLRIEHWNIIDVTEACPPDRHLPEEPKIPIFYVPPSAQQRGRSLSEAEFKLLPAEKQQEFRKAEGFTGCLKNCKLFYACRGTLATKKIHPTNLLKEIDHTISLFRKVSPGQASAQLICDKPSEEGLIYARLDRAVHMLTAAEMAEMVTGEPYPPNFSKADLIAMFKERGLDETGGLDHGYGHLFAAVMAFRDGQRMFVVDAQGQRGLELDHRVALLKSAWTEGLGVNPRIWPDTSEPGSNETIRKKGFKIQTWNKGADTVSLGIEIVRSRIYPAEGPPTLFFLKDDPGVELLFSHMTRYHWTTDAAGRLTNVPDEYISISDNESKTETDDLVDALRYMVMNEFRPRGQVKASKNDPKPTLAPVNQMPTVQNYLQHFINQNLGLAEGGDEPVIIQSGNAKGRDNKFFWDMS